MNAQNIEKTIEEILKNKTPSQVIEIIKEQSKTHIQNDLAQSSISPEENFLLNPQNEGVWSVNFSIDKNEENAQILQKIGWEDESYKYYRFRGSDKIFEKVLNFLFKLLP